MWQGLHPFDPAADVGVSVELYLALGRERHVRQARDIRDRRMVERQPFVISQALFEYVQPLAPQRLRLFQIASKFELANESSLAETVERLVLHKTEPLHHLRHRRGIERKPILVPIFARQVDE